ncbi:hypothetical protein [Bacillus sp. AFS017274]|uniref:hypothetical protein n=1 Tax=Bacillaceae TaxID=186817 RepID=UPI000BF332DE|nr:hypothetical protein [Bacillus sp. AFS017274]PEZ78409.1 hypothetical protein CN380_18375 [Bacillus sp. AFS017274]
MTTHSKEVTLNSGPFHIPTLNQGGFSTTRLVITIKNHSEHTLQADVTIDACFPVTPQPELSTFNIPESNLAFFPRMDIPRHSCQVYQVPIVFDSRPFIKVISRGDYEVIDGRPAGGKLEISVVAGGQALSGLFVSDASTFIPYGSWVVEESKSDTDS